MVVIKLLFDRRDVIFNSEIGCFLFAIAHYKIFVSFIEIYYKLWYVLIYLFMFIYI